MRKTFLYPKLALSGMRKNRRLVLPYLVTCICVVAMFTILQSISISVSMAEMRGAAGAAYSMELGKYVIAFFGVAFFLYANSFLVRRRNREFGLYNVLGMSKKNISRIIGWETFFTAVLSIVVGIFFGAAFSKLAEAALFAVIRQEITPTAVVYPQAIWNTALIFGCVFLLLLVKNVLQVRLSKPMELLRSDSFGEKPPKGNVFLALAGAVLLLGAYYLAVTIENPTQAFFMFFVAVLMVIAGTYLLFISGSVVLCRLLKKRTSYYYKKNHFVSVASMAYRMKRNGAGLASICILSTMVLVMLSSTVSMYVGIDDMISANYPCDGSVRYEFDSLDELSAENTASYRDRIEKTLAQKGVIPTSTENYAFCGVGGALKGTYLEPDYTAINAGEYSVSDVRQIFFITAQDHNAIMGTDLHPVAGTAYIYPYRCDYDEKEMTVGNLHFTIAGKLEESIFLQEMASIPAASYVMVISDMEELSRLYEHGFLSAGYYYGFNVAEEDSSRIMDVLSEIRKNTGEDTWCSTASAESQREDFFSTFGGLLFLGAILSVLFTVIAALIIYYKQLSEGFEDHARFDIMKKVGMTDEDIRRNVNSQILTVFFAPLLMAGVHLIFAFPLVWRILQLFTLRNEWLMLLTTAVVFGLFSILYAVLYKLTAGVYYSIVSKKA